MDIGIDNGPYTGIVNIGNLSDETSLARHILDKIDNTRDKLSFLASSLEALEETQIDYYLSGAVIICNEMLEDIMEAHEMLSSPGMFIKRLASEIPTTDTPEATE